MSNSEGLSPIRSIRSKFSRKLAVLFLLVVVLIALIGFVIYVQTGSAIERDTKANMEQSTTLQANTVGEWVERTRDTTRYVSGSDQLADGDRSDVEAYLEAERERASESVVAIHHYDVTSHEVIASTEDDAAGVNYRDDGVEWAANDLTFEGADETTLTHPYHDPAADVNAVAFVSPVASNPDRAVVVVVDLAVQTEQLERPSTADGSFTHIVDDRGTIVMSHHKMGINTQNMGPADELEPDSMGVRRGLEGEIGYEEMPMAHGDGEEVLMTMGFAPVPGTDWVIMTHVPAESAYALQGDIQNSVLALVVLSVLGLGAVGVVLTRNTTRPIEHLAGRASALESGDLDADLETDRTDEIGQLYRSFDSMRVSLRERIEEVEEARNRTERINRHLEKKAEEYRGVMQECAAGDLTRRMDPESHNEAMAEIAREFNGMMTALEATTEQLSVFAAEVASSSEEVTASAEEVRSASTEISGSIQEISEGADRQNQRLKSVDEEMNGLSRTIEEIAASANEVADLAEETAQTGRDGQEAARAAIEGMNDVESESEEAVDEIQALQSEIDQIDELVEFITDVAEQTNVLALNANIEASRSAGTGDGGFGVVANEVKDLANETKEAAEDIEERIEEIKAQTEVSAEGVERTRQEIADHREAVSETVNALEEINHYAQATNDGVQEISAAAQQQAASTEEVVAIVDEAATISEETTSEAENVAAAGEEQTSSLTEVTQAVSNLSQQATQLSSELDQFETDAGVDADLSADATDSGGAADAAPDRDSETPQRDGESRDPSTGADETFSFVGGSDVSTTGPDDDEASTH